MIEIERKFRLTAEQKNKIEQTLQDEHGPLRVERQIDRVFLLGLDSFAEFKRGQPVVRLRTINSDTTLAFKRSINEAGDTVEHELGVGSAETMEKILQEMDYRCVTTVDKVRATAEAGEFTIVIDTVDKAGEFLEIEILANSENDQPEAEKRIMIKANEFGLTADDIELKKYDQLVSASTD